MAGFTAIYISDLNRFEKGYCFIRINGQWKAYSPYVYTNNDWQLAGASGAIMLPLIPSGSTQLDDTNSKKFMVRQEE